MLETEGEAVAVMDKDLLGEGDKSGARRGEAVALRDDDLLNEEEGVFDADGDDVVETDREGDLEGREVLDGVLDVDGDLVGEGEVIEEGVEVWLAEEDRDGVLDLDVVPETEGVVEDVGLRLGVNDAVGE